MYLKNTIPFLFKRNGILKSKAYYSMCLVLKYVDIVIKNSGLKPTRSFIS